VASYGRKEFVAPEVLQSGNRRIDSKSDVWMLGCTVSCCFTFKSWFCYEAIIIFHQTYLLLTGSPLFSDSYIASPIEMAKEILQVGKLESLLTESGKLAEKDISPSASFLRSCLAIKPSDRASPKEIMNGGWAICGWS